MKKKYLNKYKMQLKQILLMQIIYVLQIKILKNGRKDTQYSD